jgi:hypothetical protein
VKIVDGFVEDEEKGMEGEERVEDRCGEKRLVK